MLIFKYDTSHRKHWQDSRTLSIAVETIRMRVPMLSLLASSVPASFTVLHSLAGGLSEDDALQLPELQDLQEVDDHGGIGHHIVGQVSWQHFPIWI